MSTLGGNKKNKKTQRLPPPPSSALTNAGVCADSTHIPGETDGGAQDTGRTGRNCSNSPNLQRSSRESRGAPPSAGEGPHRSYVAELHKQTATAASVPPPPPPLPPSPYFPLEDPRPVKFSLATTANKAQSLCALNCEWHRQNAPSLLHGSLSARTPPLLVVGGDPTGCLHMYNL